MKNNNYENVDKGKRTLKVGIYIRVGSIEQLSNEARQRLSNKKLENFQKKVCNADYSYKIERGIGYTTSTEA